MQFFAVVAALAIAATSEGRTYTSTSISAADGALLLVSRQETSRAPRTQDKQQGFSDAHISPDGRLVGWLVLTANCCTSYPLPTALVIYRDGRVVGNFSGAPPIWAWAFARDGAAVAYRQRAPHGISTVAYTLRDIASGATLAEFVCYPDDNSPPGEPAGFLPTDPVPDWVWPVADECPTR